MDRSRQQLSVPPLSRTKASAATEAAARDAWPSPAPIAEAPAEQRVDGFVELYAWHEVSEAWVLSGWVTRGLVAETPIEATLRFSRGEISGTALGAFHDRPDLAGRGAGLVLALPTSSHHLGKLSGVTLRQPGCEMTLPLTSDARECTGAAIADLALPALAPTHDGPGATVRLRELLTARLVGEGYVDLYGSHPPSGGTFIVGWVSESWIGEAVGERAVVASFEGGRCGESTTMNFYDREDIRGTGLGIILHVPTASTKLGRLQAVRLRAGDAVVNIQPSDAVRIIPAAETTAHFQPVIARSDAGAGRDALLHLVTRQMFDGQNTLATLAEPVLMDFDEVIACPPDGIVLCGWMLAPRGAIRAIRVRGGSQIVVIDRQRDWMTIARPDVIATAGAARGIDDARCGFIIRVKLEFPLPHDLHMEIETSSGSLGFTPVPAARLQGMAAIRRLLGSVDMQYAEVDSIYDHVLGPPVAALNARRLQDPPVILRTQWGDPPAAPHVSVVIPLYGRIDFVEYQMALFAAHGPGPDVEIIYVLDDPPRMRELQVLCASVYARFQVAFKLLCLDRNLGFAPASNIGLYEATGRFLCFMNSDVFPRRAGWLQRLTARLEADQTLGVVGPLLLFEDGSIQHQGIDFKRLEQFGHWWFSQHPRKGWRPGAGSGLSRQIAVTGACMVLRRADALACGGFDEAFVIGDFEDTDLCFRLMERGLHCAVDLDVSLYHLERKSQAGSASPWRTNLTLFNAWMHQRRWATLIARESAR